MPRCRCEQTAATHGDLDRRASLAMTIRDFFVVVNASRVYS